MVSVCFYFQVHQPFRLRKDFTFFSIGSDQPYEDDDKNAAICRKVAEKCYLPTNQLLLELIDRFEGRFKVSFSVSGTALDQFALYAPDVLQSFQDLAKTGCVEFLSETYYHSLAFLYSEEEFKAQVLKHRKAISDLFGQEPQVFRNTELITNNPLGQVIEKMGYAGILAEGADRVLEWRSPNYVYSLAGCQKLKLLVKNYRLSDDIAFRFSDRNWSQWPLRSDVFSSWMHAVAGSGDVIGLFMDYETFGEHQWASTGIFDFLRHLPGDVLRHPDFRFATPTEVVKAHPVRGHLDMPHFVSWADTERDLTAWLGNPLQDSSAYLVYQMEKDVLATGNESLIHAWRKLQTSDHFYYMCVKWFNDGDVHKYFSPYESPYDAFICYSNALHQIRLVTQRELAQQKQEEGPRTNRSGALAEPTASPKAAKEPKRKPAAASSRKSARSQETSPTEAQTTRQTGRSAKSPSETLPAKRTKQTRSAHEPEKSSKKAQPSAAPRKKGQKTGGKSANREAAL
jgi:alpha-amylase